MKITLYTDGASRGNPGRGGWGVYIEVIKDVVAQVDEDLELADFVKQFLETGTDLSQYPSFMKEIVMVHNTDILYEENDEEPGYYIGIPFFEVPEHFSIKRVCIDIRNLFISSGLIDEDVHADTIKVFSKILTVEEEEE